MALIDRIISLKKQLYPTGRAFRLPFGGFMEKLNRGMSQSLSRAWSDMLSTFDSILPDNDNFDTEDATYLERWLGINTSSGTLLADRKLAIIRKLNHPGQAKARQHYSYIESQLQAAGFDLYVHENVPRQNPYQVATGYATEWEYGINYEYGDGDYGTADSNPFYDVIANKIDPLGDYNFDYGGDLASIFFIGGAVKGDYGDLDSDRESEFRELVLKLKPSYLVAVLFVNKI